MLLLLKQLNSDCTRNIGNADAKLLKPRTARAAVRNNGDVLLARTDGKVCTVCARADAWWTASVSWLVAGRAVAIRGMAESQVPAHVCCCEV